MRLAKMEASFKETHGDVIGGALGWMEQAYSSGELNKSVIPSINGAKLDGWELLMRLRGESKAKGLRMIVVKNTSIQISVFHIGELENIDLVRRYGKNVVYWFEKAKPDEIVDDRLWIRGFVMKGILRSAEKSRTVTCVVQCEDDGEFEKLRKKLEEAELVAIDGMTVDVSTSKKMEQETFVIVQDFTVIQEDLSIADRSLELIKDWMQLSPMVADDGKSMFSTPTMACLLANGFFSMPTVPAFNLLVVGPKRNQKSTLIKFVTQQMMGGGTPVSGTASAGKGWLVSHKEDARPSKLFTEKNALMIDEALKFIAAEDRKGIVVKTKEHFQKHMEIVQRTEVSAESGNMTIKGQMRCSLVGVDNPDEVAISSLGKAYKLADAAFRRWSFLHMVRQIPDDNVGWISEKASQEKMEAWLDITVGGSKSVRALMKATRNKINEKQRPSASKQWMMGIRDECLKELEDRVTGEEYEVIYAIEDEMVRKKIQVELKEHLDIDMRDAMQAAWLSAGAMRGWEVHNSLQEYDLVFDERQELLARMIVKELFKGRVKLLFPGIIEYYQAHGGVQRKGLGGYE